MSVHDDIEAIETSTQNVFKHISYEEGWRVLPLDDQRDMFWNVGRHDATADKVKFCPTKEKLLEWLKHEDDSGDCYANEILRSGIHRGAEITGIEVDTHTDGNKFLMLLRNENEVHEDDE
jgi:hypothetical protein